MVMFTVKGTVYKLYLVGQRSAGRRRAAGAAALRQPVPALSVRHDGRRAGRERPVRR